MSVPRFAPSFFSVHVHIVPRYDPDPAPSLPLPAEAWQASSEVTASDMSSQIEALRNQLASTL